MATIVDNYVIAGAPGDNFDCDSTSGWGKGGNANSPATQSNRIEGNYSLALQTSDSGISYWYHDISSDYRFKITEKDLGLWFFYIKGKGDNYLVQDSSAVVLRLYFGGTSKYADYHLTEKGDLSLDFGWQMLMCSGTELNGGSVGGGHNGGSDFNLDIYRIEFRLNAANKIDRNLGLDAIFIGTSLEIQDGTESDPVTFYDLEDYTSYSRNGFPIGTVKIDGKLVNIKSSIKITNNGYLFEENKYLLFNQLSPEVKHHIKIENGTFKIGKLENNKPVNGCQIVKPENKNADIIVNSDGTFLCYNSKIYRWREIKLNGTCDLNYVDFDNCDIVKFNSINNKIIDSTIHDSKNDISSYSCEIDKDLDKFENVYIYNNDNGVLINEDCLLEEVKIQDSNNYDLSVLDGKTVSLENSNFSTIRRV